MTDGRFGAPTTLSTGTAPDVALSTAAIALAGDGGLLTVGAAPQTLAVTVDARGVPGTATPISRVEAPFAADGAGNLIRTAPFAGFPSARPRSGAEQPFNRGGSANSPGIGGSAAVVAHGTGFGVVWDPDLRTGADNRATTPARRRASHSGNPEQTGAVMSRTLVTASAVVATLVAPASAGAATGTFTTQTLTERALSGSLPVTGVLSDLVATSSARVLIPSSWRRLRAPAGRRSYRNTQNRSCTYTIGYRTSSVLGPRDGAPAYVAQRLLSTSLDTSWTAAGAAAVPSGVVRRPVIGRRIRVDALWAGVLTRRADIVPAGQAAWAEIRVSAIAGVGDECHAGTWREALGPTIGDSLATARAKLRFVRGR